MSGKVTEETAFRVKVFEPNRWMLWEKAASTWAWKLLPIDREHVRENLKLRYPRCIVDRAGANVAFLVPDPVDWMPSLSY